MKQKIINMIDNNYSFSDILIENNLQDYELLNIIYYLISKEKNISKESLKKIRNILYQNFSFLNLTESKLLIISDTHLGSSNQNIEYIEQAEDIANKEQVNSIFHLGDIGDGQVDKTMFTTIKDEVEYLLETYNFFTEYPQYLLGGNHDEKYKKEGYNILKLLKEINANIIPVGYREAHFRIFNKVIALEHESKSKKQSKHIINPNFIIAGHSHKSRFKENEVYIPTLSDVITNKDVEGNEPGFMILETKKESKKTILEFTRYQTTNNGPEKIKEKIYTLK